MWGLYVEYSSSAVGHVGAIWLPYFFRVYDNMVNCNLQSLYILIVDSSDFSCGIYIGIIPLQMHQLNQYMKKYGCPM